MAQRLIQALHGDPGGLGERFVRAYLSLWEDPATAEPLHAIVRSALTSPRAAGQLRAIFSAQAVRPFTAALGGRQPDTRAALAEPTCWASPSPATAVTSKSLARLSPL
jgi:Tetracyclin repressor-like, C-terminal domain